MNRPDRIPELDLITQASRSAAQELSRLRAGMGTVHFQSISVKAKVKNIFNDEEDVLFFAEYELIPLEITVAHFNMLRLQSLQKLALLADLPDDQLLNELACSRMKASEPIPSQEAILHAALPFEVVLSTRPRGILALASTPHGNERLQEIFGDTFLVIPYARAGLPLTNACLLALQGMDLSKLSGLILASRGVLFFGETPLQVHQNLVESVKRADLYIESQPGILDSFQELINPPSLCESSQSIRQNLAILRKAISAAAGHPLVQACNPAPVIMNFSQNTKLTNLLLAGPALADSTRWTRWRPMLGRDVDTYAKTLAQVFRECFPASESPVDFAPRLVFDPEFGFCSLGRSKAEAWLAERAFRENFAIQLLADALETFQPLPELILLDAQRNALDMENHFARYKQSEVQNRLFQGEIALVTGGASGIGKACVAALLRYGAAVVSLDINPAVKTCFDPPEYLGLVCDLTDEAAVMDAFEKFTRYFGGLDMLVLNAGIFPAGCRIEALTLAEWQRVMRINLDSNLVVMREAYPLLKHSPKGGRVLVNASKNVLAPGAGAAAYSASKAAVTQMARVAALEWGKDHIRVNMIHPDAVFDTGIWTEEVIQARAAHYGLTVQQYKTRNILGVELNSHYVAELVVDMLGPRFEKITGAQIPVDGGSDRVI